MAVKDTLRRLVLEVCEQNQALCMDVADGRQILSNAIAAHLYQNGVLVPEEKAE